MSSFVLLLFTGFPGIAGTATIAALVGTYWFLGRNAPLSAALLACALILLEAAGSAFSLFDVSLAGVTYDTYLHLLGGFVTTLLLAEYLAQRKVVHALPLAASATMLLGLGVEIVELLEVIRLPSNGWSTACHSSFCPYWQDTVKDFANDALGALLVLATRTERTRQH